MSGKFKKNDRIKVEQDENPLNNFPLFSCFQKKKNFKHKKFYEKIIVWEFLAISANRRHQKMERGENYSVVTVK